MNVEIIVRIGGREVAVVEDQIQATSVLELEEHVERLKDRAGVAILEYGFDELACDVRHPCCCGRRMENKGRRSITIASQSGEVRFSRNRYRCRVCDCWSTPADGVVCCGSHRITRLLARQVCQLATLEHFTRLEQLLADQHGVHLAHDMMLNLVHDVGGAIEARRLAEIEQWQNQPAQDRQWPPPEITPQRIYVSCDGIMYCTNESEPDPQHPGQKRLRWRQMRVGCVYWQDDQERWRKRVIWGQEGDYLSFGIALFRLACQCGYRHAREKIFAADGGEWCWMIHQQYFADAPGILDWYHCNEHVWQCAQSLHSSREDAGLWARMAETRLYEQGGIGLLTWLLQELKSRRGQKRQALTSLVNYLQPRLDRTDYPLYRANGWQIGTGMIESTAKQLVGVRLKGPGMHWKPDGATAITALRAQDINQNWHHFWKSFTIAT